MIQYTESQLLQKKTNKSKNDNNNNEKPNEIKIYKLQSVLIKFISICKVEKKQKNNNDKFSKM